MLHVYRVVTILKETNFRIIMILTTMHATEIRIIGNVKASKAMRV